MNFSYVGWVKNNSNSSKFPETSSEDYKEIKEKTVSVSCPEVHIFFFFQPRHYLELTEIKSACTHFAHDYSNSIVNKKNYAYCKWCFGTKEVVKF